MAKIVTPSRLFASFIEIPSRSRMMDPNG